MTPERSLKVHQLFGEALHLPAAERAAFVRQSCGSDRELLEDVESLLAEVTQTMTSIEGQRESERPSEKVAMRVRLKERYQLKHVIGRGGFGTVYLATDEELLSKRVVVKVLQNAPAGSWARKKFRDEVHALARLNHPGIVSILDSGETSDGRPFLVMEYVEGGSLRSFIPSQGMHLEMVAEVARQAGVALEAAHQNGIWHRDLKPENILIQSLADGDLRVKLIDFGIARVQELETSGDSVSRVAGTFRYMAPEQLRGRSSAASDIYSLGVIAYEMVTGRMPFPAETAVELHGMQAAGVQVRPSALRPALPVGAERSILKALQFRESDRHSAVLDFVQELAACLRPARLPQPAIPTSREPHLGRLVSKMCNRRTQEDEFRQLLTRCSERGAGRAVFCLIHGDEGECHESLVERLAYTAEVTVSKAHGEGERPVRIAKIPWQYEGPVEVRLGRLIAWLLEQAMMQPYIGSRSTLGAFLASTSAGFVFVQHDIRAARWDYQTKSVIQAYRAHLARITADPSGPLLVVCLNVIYPCVTAGRWLLSRPRVLASRLVKARIRRDLARIAGIGIGADVATCPCLLLDELKPITRDDVLEWFSLHNILETEEQRLKTAASIFTGHGSMSLRKSMAEIETHLRNVQHAFLLERGLL